MTRPAAGCVVTLRNRQRALAVNAALLKQLVARAAALAGLTQTEISVGLVRDPAMADLNRRFHATAGPTDILTFDYGDTAELLISTDHVIAQANRFGNPCARELALYLVHGVLHLSGHRDDQPSWRRAMRAAEKRLLHRLARVFDLSSLARVDRGPARA